MRGLGLEVRVAGVSRHAGAGIACGDGGQGEARGACRGGDRGRRVLGGGRAAVRGRACGPGGGERGRKAAGARLGGGRPP